MSDLTKGKIKLRDYQQEAIDGLLSYCAANPGKDPVLELPTGSGKSVIIAEFCRQMAKRGKKVLVLCRQKELVLQNCERFTQLAWGDYTVGVYCAGLNRKESDCDVVFATVQSVAKNIHDLGHLSAILVDECHQVPPSSNSQYGQMIGEVRKYNPRCRLIGLTATPYRTSTGMVYGEGSVFDDCAYSVSVKRMLESGNITPWRHPTVDEVDVSNVKIRGNDFDLGEMGEEFEAKLESNVKEIIAASANRSKVLIFATTVKHGEALKEAIMMATGQQCGIVTGDSSKLHREVTLDQFCGGPLKYLVNIGVLTTGFDCPSVDVIAVCRATQSAGLWYQIVGRGMRLSKGKEDFLVLDFGGNFDRLGDPAEANFGRPAKAPERVNCPECSNHCLKSDVRCGECGHVLLTKICPSCMAEQPKDAKICGSKLDREDLFSDDCGFDFTQRRCRSEIRGDICLVALGPDEDICPVCGAEKERKAAGQFEKHAKRKEKAVRARWSVQSVEYNYHKPKDETKRPTLRVSYEVWPAVEGASRLDRRRFNEWVTIEHEGWVLQKATEWWKLRSAMAMPATVDEAMLIATQGGLREPSEIVTEKDGKWDRVVAAEFDEERPPVIDIFDEEAPF